MGLLTEGLYNRAREQREAELEEIVKLAKAFVEGREEATENIWYCNGRVGRELLKALGIPYIPKD